MLVTSAGDAPMQLTRNKKIIASHTYEASDHEVVMQPGNDGDAPMVLRYVEVAVMHLITLHNMHIRDSHVLLTLYTV